jgi:hypothetical protein
MHVLKSRKAEVCEDCNKTAARSLSMRKEPLEQRPGKIKNASVRTKW